MRVAIAGGNGFIGRHVTRRLLDRGHEIVWLSHRPGRVRELGFTSAEICEIAFDYHDPDGTWADEVAASSAIVNLSGHPIADRWSPRVLHLIRESRIDTTRALVRAARDAAERGAGPSVVVGASGAGYYGDCGDALLTEAASPGTDRLAQLAVGWEAEAFRAEEFGARVSVMRIGVVVGGAGFLPKMLRPMRAFVGGPLGPGRQWLPWVHVEDTARAIVHAIETPCVSGALNLAAPEEVTMRGFARALGSVTRRPSLVRVPTAGLRLVLGPVAPYLVYSQRLALSKLARSGFEWSFPQLGDALRDAVPEARKARSAKPGRIPAAG